MPSAPSTGSAVLKNARTCQRGACRDGLVVEKDASSSCRATDPLVCDVFEHWRASVGAQSPEQPNDGGRDAFTAKLATEIGMTLDDVDRLPHAHEEKSEQHSAGPPPTMVVSIVMATRSR